MQSAAIVHGLAANQTATGTSVNRPCRLHSIRCTASTAGVITVYDGIDTGGKQIFTALALVANTVYLVAGGGFLNCSIGVHIVLVSGTATFDVQTDPNRSGL